MPRTTAPPAEPVGEAFVQRWRLAAGCGALVALVLQQAPQRVVGDTKLGIALDPGGFLARTLHLWDPSTDFGVTQNQGYGYLFPMGPLFLLGHALRVPPWVVQRLWWALLLCLAFVGLVRLAERLGIGSPTSRLLAGLAFALSPRLLSTLGPISVESLPYCLAPWVLVPLVDGSRGGSTRRAAARSAVAVLGIGAVNAAAVLAALPPAVLWLLTRERGPRRRSLSRWWLLGLALATAWWVLPLLLLRRYSPPFLDHIESAATTTSVTSLVEVLRGTSDWLAYLGGSHGPTWPAGFALVSVGLTVALTVVVLLAGLAGLTRRDLPEHLWLTLCLLVGVTAVTFGHVGALAPPWSPAERQLLDGALAPFRNVHKFDVVLRLPLALGAAHLVAGLLDRCPPDGRGARLHRRAVLLGAVAAIVGAALPAVSPGLAPRQPFVALPGYWAQAARWLADHPGGRTLVLPGSATVDYLWGNPNDEPLQVLARTPWAVRGAVPLTPAGTIRLLDAVEARLASGRPSPGLADSLARAGVGFLLVRNDLAYGATGSTRPLLVHTALVGSPGVRRVASFGGPIGGGIFGRYVDEGLEVPYPAVEIYAVDRPAARAWLHDAADAVRVTGGPEAVLDLDDRGLLQGRPVLLGGAAPAWASGPLPTVLTDTLRRREVFFGRQQDNTSATLTAAEPYRLAAPAHDYLTPGSAAGQSVAGYVGVRDVRASSSGSDPGNPGGAAPEHLPYAALDGDPGTAWRSGSGAALSAARWQVVFTGPTDLGAVSLQVEPPPPGAPSLRLRVSGDAGAAEVNVPADGGRVGVAVPGGPSSQLTVQVVGARGAGVLGLAEVVVPGVRAERTLVTAEGPGRPVLTVTAAKGDRDACYPLLGTWLCGSRLERAGEEATGLDRTVTVDSGGAYQVGQVWARPRSGAALTAVIAAAQPFTVTASSVATTAPHGGALAAMDGSTGTGWRAALGDQDPRLTVGWAGLRTVTGVQVQVSDSLAASRPQAVRITSDAGERTVALDGQGRAAFPALRTRSVTVHLLRPALTASLDPYTGAVDLSPVGVSELRLTGLPVVLPASRPVSLPCGAGPDVVVDGRVVQTALRTTTAALADQAVLPLTVCGTGEVVVSSSARVRVATTGWLTPVALTLQPVGGALRPPGRPAALATPRWTAALRTAVLPARRTTTLLQVPENASAGWVATLGGARLTPVVLDGWQQGWVVPPGAAATVTLRFAPDRTYRVGLGVGLLLVLLLLGLTRSGRQGALAPTGGRRTTGPWLVTTGLLVVLVGGAAGALSVVALVAGRRALRLRAAVGPATVAVAGVLLALRPWTTVGYAGRGAAAQALCVVGLAAIWSMLLTASRRPARRSSGRSSRT